MLHPPPSRVSSLSFSASRTPPSLSASTHRRFQPLPSKLASTPPIPTPPTPTSPSCNSFRINPRFSNAPGCFPVRIYPPPYLPTKPAAARNAPPYGVDRVPRSLLHPLRHPPPPPPPPARPLSPSLSLGELRGWERARRS